MGKSPSARIFGGIILVLALIILAIIANSVGWSTGADKILTAALVLICAIPVGSFFVETGKKHERS